MSLDDIGRAAAARVHAGLDLDDDRALAAVGDRRRRRRRRRTAALAATGCLAVVAVALVAVGPPDHALVTAGSETTTTPSTVAPPPTTEAASILTGLPVAVEPHADLADGQTVEVRGEGFAPGVQVGAIQCSSGATEPGNPEGCDLETLTYASTDGSGAAVLTFVVRRTLATSRFGDVDCTAAPNACRIGMGEVGDHLHAGSASISFAPAGEQPPPPSPPTLAVVPSDGLADGGVVEVTGGGFEPGRVELTQCAAGDEWTCTVVGDVQAGDDGRVATTVHVWRGLDGHPGTFDCAAAPAACVLRADDLRGRPAVEVGLDFAGTEVLDPDPTITAAPGAAGLDVAGAGFRTPEVFVQVCDGVDISTTSSCGPALDGSGAVLGGVAVGPDGALAVSVRSPLVRPGQEVVVLVTELPPGPDEPPARSAMAVVRV